MAFTTAPSLSVIFLLLFIAAVVLRIPEVTKIWEKQCLNKNWLFLKLDPLVSLDKFRGLYTPRYIPYGIHMEWVDSIIHSMDSIWNTFRWVLSYFFIPSPPWIPHGMDMEWYIPHGFHGLFQVDSIARHIEIPWENIIKCVIKNSNNIENRTLDSAKSHVQRWGRSNS